MVLTIIVAGIYWRWERREARAEKDAPPAVPATVLQQSAAFSFSKGEGNSTLFTVRASEATEYKGTDRSLLQDVTVTVFGHDGSRNDTIQAKACDYASDSGQVVCQGATQIVLQSAEDAKESPERRAVHVETTDVTFNRATGIASTPATAALRFPGGTGTAKGLEYNSNDGIAVMEHDVTLTLRPEDHPADPATQIHGSRMEFRRNELLVQLSGPVNAQRGGDVLSTQELLFHLDANMRPRSMEANGNPELRHAQPDGISVLNADQFVADLDAKGNISHFWAKGEARGGRQTTSEQDKFSADQMDVTMDENAERGNEPRELVANGNVVFHGQQGSDSRMLHTTALQFEFAPEVRGQKRHIERGKTLAPGVVEMASPGEKTTLGAQRFNATFNAAGRMDLLQGRSGIVLDRTEGQSAPQHLTAQEMDIHYGPQGDWSQMDSRGEVRFRQGDRTAEANSASMARDTNQIKLEGSPVVADANSRTTANHIEFNQTTGDMTATGRVFTLDHSSGQQSGPEIGQGPAQISADRLIGNSQKGEGLYQGNARMWQGEAVVQADQIRLSRDPQVLDAAGNVLALLPQEHAANAQKPAKTTVWTIHAPHLRYVEADEKVHLETGVKAESDQGTIRSRTLDAYLKADPNGKRSVDHAVALGNVIVEQPGRQGSAERADYFAADQKYVLSGGQPTLVDASRGTTTGHSLTYYVASDTILVDARGGSRTLTEHRIEK